MGLKTNTKLIVIISAVVMLTLGLSACSALDVVGNDSVRAFGDILEALPAEGSKQDGWSIIAPDSEARFVLRNDVMEIVVDAKPFIDAGLDISKLENAGEDGIVYLTPGFDMLNQNIKSTPLEQFDVNIQSLRSYIGYHAEMDHYNISIDDGNMFEWAKDMSKNDKDIVFVLNPEPLIAAGVDPEAVEGWVFAKVTVNVDGKMTEVDKFLKPFDLK